jgi:Holliday junction resolvase RusA-like endonuclease
MVAMAQTAHACGWKAVVITVISRSNYLMSSTRDRDNLLTNVLDCLREAGVIVNDNIKSFNGALIMLQAGVDENERVRIEVIV